MSPIKSIRQSVPVDSPVTLSSRDAALAREFLQFAVEQINDTLVLAERNRSHMSAVLEAYRDDAVALLERMGR